MRICQDPHPCHDCKSVVENAPDLASQELESETGPSNGSFLQDIHYLGLLELIFHIVVTFLINIAACQTYIFLKSTRRDLFKTRTLEEIQWLPEKLQNCKVDRVESRFQTKDLHHLIARIQICSSTSPSDPTQPKVWLRPESCPNMSFELHRSVENGPFDLGAKIHIWGGCGDLSIRE